ncbi:MAG: hypothetical protein V4477_14635 [Pseudomonadota bacterium]|uniref:hypothetical protein n=1 Tax=Tardiphaga sp. TaxID=1926292 RepID=UPI00334EDA27
MVARYVLGAVIAATVATPALAGSMTAEEARKFVAGKVFAFTCFDGTRGAGRVFDDGGAAGAVQFSGSGPARNMRLPGNTLQVRGDAICASIKGIPFEPCFNLNKNDERSFRGSVSGMGFAYCDFRHQGGRGQMLMARSLSAPRSLRAPSTTRSADASAGADNTVTRVSTPRVESSKIDAVGSIKSEPAKEIAKTPEPEKTEALELRKSTN